MTDAIDNFWCKIYQKIISEDVDIRLDGLVEARKALTDDEKLISHIDAAIRAGIVQVVTSFIEDPEDGAKSTLKTAQ